MKKLGARVRPPFLPSQLSSVSFENRKLEKLEGWKDKAAAEQQGLSDQNLRLSRRQNLDCQDVQQSDLQDHPNFGP